MLQLQGSAGYESQLLHPFGRLFIKACRPHLFCPPGLVFVRIIPKTHRAE